MACLARSFCESHETSESTKNQIQGRPDRDHAVCHDGVHTQSKEAKPIRVISNNTKTSTHTLAPVTLSDYVRHARDDIDEILWQDALIHAARVSTKSRLHRHRIRVRPAAVECTS